MLQGKLLDSNSEAEVSDFGSIVVQEGMATQSEVEQASQIQQRKIGEVMVDEGIISDEEVKVVLDKQEQQEVKVQKQKKGNETLRVTAQKIDSLIQLIGELSVQMSIIKHGSKTCVLNPTTAKAVELSDKICREIQGESLSLRMQPLKKLFQRLERIIYDLATSMNKIVEVRFEGSEVELDKLIIENISDPLIHIVRNAVDHGLEDLEERLDSGKDAEAVIKIMAIQDPAGVIIKIQDDGRGINADKVFTKALERGIVKIDQKLTTKEITQLIFEPGFSTAEKVTDVSGRGVGMDIVRKAVERISGNLEVDSEFGKGTTFNIMLPTSLSIIDALLIEVDNEQYAVPLLEVSEIIDLSHHIQEENSRMINLRGSIVPVENLSEYFPITQYREEVTTSSDSVPYSRPALVVDVNRNNIAFEVDKVIGQHQIVVKNFNDFLSPVIGFSGSCIMANGEAGMIIELKKIAEGHIKNQAISRGIYE